MTRKKLILYGTIILVFLVFCVMYVMLMLQSANELYQQRLRESIGVSASQIQKHFEYMSKDMLFDLNGLGETGYQDMQTLYPKLRELEDKEGLLGQKFYLLTAEGALFDSSGESAGHPIDRGFLKSARSEGYAVAAMYDTAAGAQSIALIVPLFDRDLYLVQACSMQQFLDELSSKLTFTAKYLGLYDEWGNPVNTGLQAAADPGLEREVRDGATVYISNRNTHLLQKTGLDQNYNVYIPLAQPSSWFLGARVDFYEDYPLFSGIFRSSAIMFFSWLFLVIAIILLDIINDREKKKELFLVSHIDQLTGLINNAGMSEAMSDFMHKHPMQEYSLVCLDIVAFSRINNMFGYSMGDTLLRTLSKVISSHYLAGARTNADRFAFFAISSPELTEEVKSHFYRAIQNEMGPEFVQLVTFKFGVYPMKDAKPSFREVYECALLALKDAKKASQQNEVVYDSELRQIADMRKNIELNMMHALSKEEFIMYIHPQFYTDCAECRRGEALVRWQSEFMGFLPPDKFIPLFESNGFIVEIDFFMLTSALQLLQDRLDKGKEMLTLAVNQSKVTISFPNYFERLKQLVSRFGVPLSYVELEITESALENDMASIVPLIHSIKKLGFTVSLDDFGSGFSSLNTLRLLPIDVLKIDRAFLQESGSSDRSKTIIRNVVNMAKELHIEVVCEGVETKEQLDFLRETGCDIMQGYYYSKPIPCQEFLDFYIDQQPVDEPALT